MRPLTPISLLMMALLLGAPLARGEGPADPAAPLVQIALADNPDLGAIKARIAALDEAVGASRPWRDPMVSIELSNVPWRSPSLSASPMSGVQIRVQQTLPGRGVHDAREAVSRAEAKAGSYALEEARLALAQSVAVAFWGLAHARERRRLTERQIEAVSTLIASSQARYESGALQQGALLRLTLLRDRLADGLYDHDDDARVLLAALNEALARPAGTPVETPRLTQALPPPEATVDALTQRAAEGRALVQQRRAEAEVARQRALVAQLGGRPELSVWAGYRVRASGLSDGGADFISLGMGIPVPVDWGHRWQAERRVAEAQALASERSADAALNHIQGELERALSRWQRAHERALSYERQLLPLGRGAVDDALIELQAGRGEFESLYQAEIALIELEAGILDARLQTRVQAAKVKALVGEAR